MVLAHLLVEYEVKLENPNVRPCFSFGKARLPNPFMVMLIRKRVSFDKNNELATAGR